MPSRRSAVAGTARRGRWPAIEPRWLTHICSTATFTIRLSHDTPEGFELSGADQSFVVEPLGELSRSCVVFAAAKAYQGQRDLKIEIHGEPGNITLTETVKFLGPNPILLHEEAEKAGSHEDDDEKEHN
jgi:hypothetical protein